MVSARSPFTQISPPSGLSSPRISFRMVDFPEPLAPRMILVCPRSSVKLTSRRMTVSSKASDTRSRTSTGGSSAAGVLNGVGRVGRTRSRQYSSVMRSCVTNRSTAITATDEATTALVVARPTPCVPPLVRKTDMATDGDDGEAEAERLDQSHPDVVAWYSPSMTEDQYRLPATRS